MVLEAWIKHCSRCLKRGTVQLWTRILAGWLWMFWVVGYKSIVLAVYVCESYWTLIHSLPFNHHMSR